MKLKLKFVNKGKPFELKNDWSVEKQEKVLELMVQNTVDMDDNQKDREFKYYVIYVGLSEIDSEIKMEEIRKLHPENIADLWTVIYTKGKVDIFFREKKSKKTK